MSAHVGDDSELFFSTGEYGIEGWFWVEVGRGARLNAGFMSHTALGVSGCLLSHRISYDLTWSDRQPVNSELELKDT